jgi:exodeoxyribonuclease VII large subunit
MAGSFVLTVTQLNTYVKSLLDGDVKLANIFIAGEISNFTDHYRSGHLYFTLKDEKCAVSAVMFSRYAARLRFRPEDGMKVIARGKVSVYEAAGRYQLYIEDMQPEGIGALSLAFEQLKNKLEKEGLFAAERKKPIPRFPEKIGVITSPTGAAVHDIITVLDRRYPAARIIFCPVLVQGENAAPQITDAIGRFNRAGCADVIILGRGGGSIEDLWAFNEESVARAVAASRIPIISAVGHETDFTICDFAADLRAPTPSAAAELAVPDAAELLYSVLYQKDRMLRAMSAKTGSSKERIDGFMKSRVFTNPLGAVETRRINLDGTVSRLNKAVKDKMSKSRALLSETGLRLNSLSPLSVLGRGYAAVYGRNGKSLSSVEGIGTGDKITVKMSDGELGCTVNSKAVKRSVKNSFASEAEKYE